MNRYRADIDDWTHALMQAETVHQPDRRALLDIYTKIDGDGLLTSQMKNRRRGTTAARYALVDAVNKPNEAATNVLQDAIWFKDVMNAILDTTYYGNSVVELDVNNYDRLEGALIDRRHILPESGGFRPNVYLQSGVNYRDTAEYGTYILEFGTKYDLGLLNKAVPYVLMKTFALGCFSEFLEKFGQPPTIIKTNTDDPAMVNRVMGMLENLGSSAAMVLDTEEAFELGTAVTSDGALYDTLIRILNNEISMLISSAVIGQDTKNGNHSKETSSITILQGLMSEDRDNVASAINTVLLPALVQQGVLPEGLRFQFIEEEDKEALFTKVAAVLPYFDVDPDFIAKTFGIPVSPKQNAL